MGAAIESVAGRLGASAETVRKWVRRAEIDACARPGLTSPEHAEVKRLKREVAELRRANPGSENSNAAAAATTTSPTATDAGSTPLDNA